MNSEKSYDSLPNFTAADCKYLIMLKNEAVFRVSLCMRALAFHYCAFNLEDLKDENSKQHY